MESIITNQDNVRKHNLESLREDKKLSFSERVLSVVLGTMITVRSLKRNPLKRPLKLLTGSYLLYRGLTGTCKLSQKLNCTDSHHKSTAVNVQSEIIVNKPREEVYAYWRYLANLPNFMKYIKRVEEKNDTMSRWELELPWGSDILRWDTVLIKDKPNQLIGWHSQPNSVVENSGKVEFSDVVSGVGTVINLVVTYHAPAGQIGRSVANLFTPAFEKLLESDLRNFKELIETGQLTTIEFY